MAASEDTVKLARVRAIPWQKSLYNLVIRVRVVRARMPRSVPHFIFVLLQ
jgi:hypothetical protein